MTVKEEKHNAPKIYRVVNISIQTEPVLSFQYRKLAHYCVSSLKNIISNIFFSKQTKLSSLRIEKKVVTSHTKQERFSMSIICRQNAIRSLYRPRIAFWRHYIFYTNVRENKRWFNPSFSTSYRRKIICKFSSAKLLKINRQSERCFFQ